MVLCVIGHPRRHQHGRRFRDDQRHDDPALPAAELHGHGLSRDQAGGDRHRDHVHDPGARAGDRGPPDAKAARDPQGAIRFEDVRFAYEPDAADPEGPELRGAGRAAPSRSSGPSGAGKSTISRLLFRFYDLTGGRITIDGQDIRDVTQRSLRAASAWFRRIPVLFNDTIRYNIRYGRWDASDAEVEEAAALRQIDGFIRHAPDGYETEVGERGLKLSGGEKQRVAIARTILKVRRSCCSTRRPRARQPHREGNPGRARPRVARRTTLVIAHRLSTIVGADEIIVLDQGVIASAARTTSCC
jgi:ATP-binding cassette subfamily B protein